MAETSTSNSNRLLKKQRVMRYFIDAAREISNEEGPSAVTIRSVAAKAGYNSASLYNYFEDLNHLMAFASIDLVIDWISEVSNILSGDGDALDKYILTWKTFIQHSSESPLCYAYIYDSVHMEVVVKYFDDYFQIFPEAKEKCSEDVIKQDKLRELLRQESTVIEPCIEEGFFKKEDQRYIYQFVLLLCDGILWGATHYEPKTVQENVDMFMRYLIEFLKHRLCKEKDLSIYLP